MPNSGEFRQFPAEYSETTTRCPGVGAGIRQTPVGSADTRVPLLNLSTLRLRMDSLHRFLSESVNRNTLIGKDQMDMVSTEIVSAIHQIIVNGAALLACTQNPNLEAQAAESTCPMASDPNRSISGKSPITDPKPKQLVDPKVEVTEEESEECEIIELDSMELLAEHIHLCDICGKGFKRDANLRMHMRAHGNQYKTAEALAKPDRCSGDSRRRARFSCPYVGCNRNKFHKKFRPLKSVICVKNHFKRSHCPKMYSCNRCNKKSFSVVADLKSHLKHCGDSKWRCSCGTSFSRKDKLFGHMALFEGHMPAVAQDDEKSKGGAAAAAASSAMMEEDEDNGLFLDGLLEGFGSIDSYCIQDVFTSPHPGLDTGMEDFYDDF